VVRGAAMTVEIWCDGSSTGRPDREWGWGYVIAKDGVPIVCDFGGGPSGTNNVAEMEAAVQGITKLARMLDEYPTWWQEKIVLVSDSMYTLTQANGSKNAYKNVEKANQLRMLFSRYCTGIRHVKGHSGEHLNERCDKLAKKGKDVYAKR